MKIWEIVTEKKKKIIGGLYSCGELSASKENLGSGAFGTVLKVKHYGALETF